MTDYLDRIWRELADATLRGLPRPVRVEMNFATFKELNIEATRRLARVWPSDGVNVFTIFGIPIFIQHALPDGVWAMAYERAA